MVKRILSFHNIHNPERDEAEFARRRSYEVEGEQQLMNKDRTSSLPMVTVKSEENHTKVRTSITHHEHGEIREQWSEKLDFLLSIIGFAVDLANIWRFPYLCYKNGGGAFLIPYALSVILGGMPLFYLELLLGQYYRQGAITCWKKICPLLAGIGWAVTVIAFYTDFYYNVVISWALYYLFASFRKMLPWSKCDHQWNTPSCSALETRRDFLGDCINRTWNATDLSLSRSSLYENCSEQLTNSRIVSPAQEYFHLQVYRLNKQQNLSMSDLGQINWENLVCLALIYLICYFSMWKGVKTSGKVVWFTALFPYVVLAILMVRGFFLEGAMKGILYYIKPDLSKLTDASVWVDAASQTFFSLGPGFGVLMAFASYNDFHHNVYRDAMITVAVNSLTSFASGFVIFMFLGYMSEISGREIKDVAEQGSTLVFIVYPEAIATMPWAPVWSIFFFLMLLTLGLDSSVFLFFFSRCSIYKNTRTFSSIKCKRPFNIHGSTIECHSDDGYEVTGDIAPPLHLTTTFLSDASESYGQVYSRMDNITRRRVEAVLGAIQGGDAITYSSGLSAVQALIHAIKPRRIYLNSGYHGVIAAFKLWNERHSLTNGQVEFLTLDQCKLLYTTQSMKRQNKDLLWQPAAKEENRTLDLIWLESPNNPYTTLMDIEWFAELAARTGACLAIDSTLSSPLGQRPFEHGAHVVMHSSTKYLSGHSDLLGGVLVMHSSLTNILTNQLLAERTIDGAVMGHLETWLLLRSLRTLSLRLQRQSQTALILAQWLEQQHNDSSLIRKVYHPNLKSHPSYSLASRYLRLPPATFSFELQSEIQAKLFAKSLFLCSQATSLGGVETLIDWRYRYDTSVSPSLLRISVGIEEPEDIIQDFEQALKIVKEQS